jgi:hypothetical protein
MLANLSFTRHTFAKFVLFISLCCLVIVTGGCKADPNFTSSSRSQIEYVGRVVNQNTNIPIRDAKVTFDFQGAPPVVYTDSEGIYRFTINVASDKITGRVGVEADNYEKYNRNITLYTGLATIDDIRLIPLVPTPTFTPTPIPTNTFTPAPTNTSAPTPTPTFTPSPRPTATLTPIPPDTSPGSSLEVGEVWRQDGMILEIENAQFYAQYCTDHWSCFESCCIKHSVAIAIEFILTNRTGQDILLDFDQLRFVVQDDAGKTYQVARTMQVGSDKQHTNTVSEILKNGQRYRIYIMFGDDIAVTSHATQIFVRVTTLSRIRSAVWSIKIPR